MSCGQYTESSAGRIRVVTSGTRPTGVDRYVGQRIFESDTGCELLYDGTGWVIMSEPTRSYTPTWVNVSNATRVGTYHRSDGWCWFTSQATLTGSSAVSGRLSCALPPFNAAGLVFATGIFIDTGNATYPAIVTNDATGVYLDVSNASGTYTIAGFAASNAPFVWGNTDTAAVAGIYQMSSRYS